MQIRLPLSVDHHKKKAVSLHLPFSVYLYFVTTPTFERILPDALRTKGQGLKQRFLSENRFFSEEYQKEYERSGYIRFLTGPDVHKFFVKVLSLNYQAQKDVLRAPAGSFQEYFADLNLFWNAKYVDEATGSDPVLLREALFCQACLQAQYLRVVEQDDLREKLDDFAKQELAARDAKIKHLQAEVTRLRDQCDDLQAELGQEREKNIVLVPDDPHYMLGLHPDQSAAVEKRAKALLKVLHPDRSGSDETAYLFDMVLRARDTILK